MMENDAPLDKIHGSSGNYLFRRFTVSGFCFLQLPSQENGSILKGKRPQMKRRGEEVISRDLSRVNNL